MTVQNDRRVFEAYELEVADTFCPEMGVVCTIHGKTNQGLKIILAAGFITCCKKIVLSVIKASFPIISKNIDN